MAISFKEIVRCLKVQLQGNGGARAVGQMPGFVFPTPILEHYLLISQWLISAFEVPFAAFSILLPSSCCFS